MKKIAKYLEACDRMNAPVLLMDEMAIIPVEEPYAFVQPRSIDLDELSTIEEVNLSIRNAGGGFLIIPRVSTDVDWIEIEDTTPKKALEWTDDPLTLKVKIDREKLPAGEHSGVITVEMQLEEKTLHRIPVGVRVPKEDAAIVVASPDVVDFGSVPLHKEYRFTFRNGSASMVYLQGAMTNWESGSVLMTKDNDEFYVTIPLEDGEYLYQFNVDGRNLPDPGNQQRVVIGDRGVCSKLVLNRFSRVVEIRNISPRAMRVDLIPSGEEISLSQPQIKLSRGERTQITINLLPRMMNPGAKSYRVDIQVRSQP